MRTETNYYRAVLQEVYEYPAKRLELMTDQDCEKEYQIIQTSY